MNRRFINTLCSVLVLASYIWGGCVSCQEIIQSEKKTEDCCQHDKCKRSSHSEKEPAPQPEDASCEKTEWAIAATPDTRSASVNVAAEIDIRYPIAPADQFIRGNHAQLLTYPLASASPPDLTVLHSSLLI